MDDQTLALSTIEARVKTWRDQDNYQKRLLLDLAQRLSLPAAKIEQVSENSLQGLAVLREYAAQKQAAINPQFSEKKVVYKTGEVILVNTLKLGPVQWFWNAQQQQGGLLDDDNNVQYLYGDKHNAQLAELYQKGRASLSFDPTLTRALQLSQQQESLWQHIERGGIWAMPIMFFALFALVIALTKVWQLWRLPPLTPLLVERIDAIAKSATVAELHQRLVQLQQQLQGAQKELVGIVLSTPESSQRDDKLLAYLIEHRQQLTTRLGAIAITAAVAPLLGLLGTVSGMIETFQMMNLFGAGDPSVVSGGISKALITTELGLVVAIPALILHALISRQIKHYNTQLDTTAIRLGNLETQQR
ncbi:MotA/TolQ/ExbB proton channel family protein [Paraglaciecola aquimarina]|uniref:MotA/TolQ/ExbB proton channel family protein n=1 Tax=Paraglaciecola aquimarina TaxID=1235557 RepID=A0ABU3T079_9ALTE|nr:MotA/TolQ/ExbB proton channel family protein [Paraglaciecola aquimarina]MDU0355668.1 MotA/TolQ/ExbB proton channel family protein [Paraglaciecola aquimarina]